MLYDLQEEAAAKKNECPQRDLDSSDEENEKRDLDSSDEENEIILGHTGARAAAAAAGRKQKEAEATARAKQKADAAAEAARKKEKAAELRRVRKEEKEADKLKKTPRPAARIRASNDSKKSKVPPKVSERVCVWRGVGVGVWVDHTFPFTQAQLLPFVPAMGDNVLSRWMFEKKSEVRALLHIV